jgi:carboxylesterase type B
MTSGASASVPLLVGCNQTETTILGLIAELPAVAAMDEAGLRKRVASALVVGSDTDYVTAAYRKAWPQATPGDLLLLIDSDRWMRSRSVELAERKFPGSTAPVFMYLPTWPRFTPATRATMLFDNQSRVESDPFGERAVWPLFLPKT